MKRFVYAFFFLSVLSAQAQDNYEIQVYGSPTQEKGTTQVELHSNYTFKGEKDIVKGVRPTQHATHETLEITQAIADNFEIGLYCFTNYSQQYGYQYVGSHIRPRITLPEKWGLPVGLSLSAEVGFQKKEYSSDTWSCEIRPIIDKEWKKLYIAFNPVFGVSLKSAYNTSTPDVSSNLKISYKFLRYVCLGFEYYGTHGYINSFDKLSKQSQALFFTYDLEDNPTWEFNIGAGFGLTQATDGFVLKTILGRKINWHKKR